MQLDEVRTAPVDDIAPFLRGLGEPAGGLPFGHRETGAPDRISSAWSLYMDTGATKECGVGTFAAAL